MCTDPLLQIHLIDISISRTENNHRKSNIANWVDGELLKNVSRQTLSNE